MANSMKKLQVRLLRDVGYMKPKGYENYKTLTETSVAVERDPSWLRKLESDGRIPKAHRVKLGGLSIRLWSPNQIKEIKQIVNNMKRGRPTSG